MSDLAAPAWLRAWPVAYVHRSRSWTVRSRSGTAWGALSPETGVVEPIEPADDRRLPGLVTALQSGRLIGYRYRRRAIVRSDDGTVGDGYIKVLRPSRLEAVADTHRRLGDANLSVRFPRVVSTHGDGRLQLEALPGSSLHDLIRSQHSPDLMLPIERIAEALADLHQLQPASEPPAREPVEPPVGDTLETWSATVGRADPDSALRLNLVARRLPSLPQVPEVLIHGDLHDKNVLLSDHGVSLIDLDGVRLGSAEDELANLGVHLRLRCLQSGRPIATGRELTGRLYRRYRELRELSVDRLDAAEQHTWFRLAALYHFRLASRALVPTLLDLASLGDRSHSTVDQR